MPTHKPEATQPPAAPGCARGSVEALNTALVPRRRSTLRARPVEWERLERGWASPARTTTTKAENSWQGQRSNTPSAAAARLCRSGGAAAMDCSPLVDDSPCDGLLDALGQAIACPTQPANDERAALPIAAGLASPPPAHAPPLQPAARVFESLCTHMGVPPHPELLASINNLPANAFAPLKPYSHPGQGAHTEANAC